MVRTTEEFATSPKYTEVLSRIDAEFTWKNRRERVRLTAQARRKEPLEGSSLRSDLGHVIPERVSAGTPYYGGADVLNIWRHGD